MLAYIFWHWPRPGADARVYESRLARFQDVLRNLPVTGFRDSAVYRVAGAPWFPAGIAGYEEVYLLDNSCAMDLLNDAAVSEPSRRAHDEAIEFCAAAAAGLYRLRHGLPSLTRMVRRYWLAKPRDTKYTEFDAAVLPTLSASPSALWRRQMVLGPTPEFCLQSAGALEVPASMLVFQIETEVVWHR